MYHTHPNGGCPHFILPVPRFLKLPVATSESLTRGNCDGGKLIWKVTTVLTDYHESALLMLIFKWKHITMYFRSHQAHAKSQYKWGNMKLNFINFMVKLVYVFVKCVCQINLNIIARSKRCNADRTQWVYWDSIVRAVFHCVYTHTQLGLPLCVHTHTHTLGASLVAQLVKNLPAVWETWVWFLGQEDSLEKEMAAHSSILAWRIPWTEEPGGLQFMGSQESHMT